MKVRFVERVQRAIEREETATDGAGSPRPQGQEPFGGLTMASCACADGMQNDPLDV
jgi:hypothetical protein